MGLDKIDSKMVKGFDEALAKKAEKVHTHTISQVSGVVPSAQLPYAGDKEKGAVRVVFNSATATLYISNID